MAAARRLNPGSAALRRLDLPTPELPVRAESFPARRALKSSMPSPVSALVQTTGNPAAR